MKPCVIALLLGLAAPGTAAMATEEPPFTVSLAEGDFAVRDYPALVVAEVAVTGDQKAAASKGFRLLAGYIFGGNTRRQAIAMTAPVVQAPASEKIPMTAPVLQAGSGDAWTVQFVMPHGMTLATLPVPNDPAVKLRALPPARVAVVRFNGLARPDDVAARTHALTQWIAAQHLHATGASSLAQYDPPWTLWFMRRNEIMIPVAR